MYWVLEKNAENVHFSKATLVIFIIMAIIVIAIMAKGDKK